MRETPQASAREGAPGFRPRRCYIRSMPSDPENARRWLDLLRSKNSIKENAIVPREEQTIHFFLPEGSRVSNMTSKVWIEGEFLVSCGRIRDKGGRVYHALSDILSIMFGEPYKH